MQTDLICYILSFLKTYKYLKTQNKLIAIFPLQLVLNNKKQHYSHHKQDSWNNPVVVEIKTTKKYYEFEFLMFFGWYVSVWQNDKPYHCIQMYCSTNFHQWEEMINYNN